MDFEIIDRLCESIRLMQEIIRKQEEIIAQHEIILTGQLTELKEINENNLSTIEHLRRESDGR